MTMTNLPRHDPGTLNDRESNKHRRGMHIPQNNPKSDSSETTNIKRNAYPISASSPTPVLQRSNEKAGKGIMSNDRASPHEGTASQRTGRWSLDEKILFLYGLKRFGKGRWKKISIYLPNRSLVQIKSHAQKVLKHMETGENVFRRLDENASFLKVLVDDIHMQYGMEDVDIASQATLKSSRRSPAARRGSFTSHKDSNIVVRETTPVTVTSDRASTSKRSRKASTPVVHETPIEPHDCDDSHLCVPGTTPSRSEVVFGSVPPPRMATPPPFFELRDGTEQIMAASALCQLATLDIARLVPVSPHPERVPSSLSSSSSSSSSSPFFSSVARAEHCSHSSHSTAPCSQRAANSNHEISSCRQIEWS